MIIFEPFFIPHTTFLSIAIHNLDGYNVHWTEAFLSLILLFNCLLANIIQKFIIHFFDIYFNNLTQK